MKRFWAFILLIVVAAILFIIYRAENPPAQNPSGQNGVAGENASNVSRPPAGGSTVALSNVTGMVPTQPASNDLAARAASPAAVPASVAGTNEAPVLPPLTILDHARVVMHNYRDACGEDPVGDNAEITAALMGKNPKQINFVPADSGLRLNEKGEMVDAWGTPFFFHQISGKEMEIRSAGKDRVMWTPDDLLTR